MDNAIPSVKEYFEGINLALLPINVGTYIKDNILSDPQSLKVSVDDKYFKDIKSLIDTEYPHAYVSYQPEPNEQPKATESEEKSTEEQIISLERKVKIFKMRVPKIEGKDKESLERKIRIFEMKLKKLHEMREKGGKVAITLQKITGDPTPQTGEVIGSAVVQTGDPVDEQMQHGGEIKKYTKGETFYDAQGNLYRYSHYDKAAEGHYVKDHKGNYQFAGKHSIERFTKHDPTKHMKQGGEMNTELMAAIWNAHYVLVNFERLLGDKNEIITPFIKKGWAHTNDLLKKQLEQLPESASPDLKNLLQKLEFIINEIRMEGVHIRKQDKEELPHYIKIAKEFLQQDKEPEHKTDHAHLQTIVDKLNEEFRRQDEGYDEHTKPITLDNINTVKKITYQTPHGDEPAYDIDWGSGSFGWILVSLAEEMGITPKDIEELSIYTSKNN